MLKLKNPQIKFESNIEKTYEFALIVSGKNSLKKIIKSTIAV